MPLHAPGRYPVDEAFSRRKVNAAQRVRIFEDPDRQICTHAFVSDEYRQVQQIALCSKQSALPPAFRQNERAQKADHRDKA